MRTSALLKSIPFIGVVGLAALAGWQSKHIDETPPRNTTKRLAALKSIFNGPDIQALESHRTNTPARRKPSTQVLIQDVFPEKAQRPQPSDQTKPSKLFAPYQQASHGQLIASSYEALTPKGSTQLTQGSFLNHPEAVEAYIEKKTPQYQRPETFSDYQAQALARAVDEDRLATEAQVQAALKKHPSMPLVVNQSFTIDPEQGGLGFLKNLHPLIIRKDADWRALKKAFPLGVFGKNRQGDAKWYRDVYQHPDMKAARQRYEQFLKTLPSNVLLVRANGNEGESQNDALSTFRLSAGGLDLSKASNVLAVGAAKDEKESQFPAFQTSKKGVTSFSTRGQYPPDVTADGVFFLAGQRLNAQEQTAELVTGTSFSTPVVGALAVALWDKNPKLSASEVKKAIVSHAKATPHANKIDEGAGRIQVQATLQSRNTL
ncbi:MAG: S8 family serine peptidase [Vampirovibrionales bacterium]